MNKQKIYDKQGNITKRLIEWTDWTWNPVAGCPHACRWSMPDGTVAICYAEKTAESYPAMNHYPAGFDHHYWHPHRLEEPLKVKEPAKIFLDSMSDLLSVRVPDDQIQAVLQIAGRAGWHTFQLLTKNSPRLAKLTHYPLNVWYGVSSAPDSMFGKPLDRNQQERYMHKALTVLSELPTELVTWISFEPLSWDVSRIVAQYPGVLGWAVIGAASNGNKYYQPDPRHVQALLEVLDDQGVPIFFKGNLEWPVWREDFPGDQRQYEATEVMFQPSLLEAAG
jgi:protein gp37